MRDVPHGRKLETQLGGQRSGYSRKQDQSNSRRMLHMLLRGVNARIAHEHLLRLGNLLSIDRRVRIRPNAAS